MVSYQRSLSIKRCGIHRRGFTLAELSIVTLILSLMAAVAVPRYMTALYSYQAEAAATRIKVDLELLRQSARKFSASRNIVFDVLNSSYTISSLKDLDHAGRSTYVVKLKQSPYKVQLTSANCGGDATLAFDGHGKPDSAATIVVTCGNFSKTVLLDANSGKASIQ